jgi:hypothetical protein
MQKNHISYGAGKRWDKPIGKKFAATLRAGSLAALGRAGIRTANIRSLFIQWLMGLPSEIGELIAWDGKNR